MNSQDPGAIEDFRQLDELLRGYTGRHLFEDVLRPAISAAVKLLDGLQRYRKRLPTEAMQITDSWSFFALSVVNDALRLPLRLSLSEYLHFFESLGFEPFEGGSFSPVRHEIVEVGNWTRREEGIRVGRSYWPGLRWGELIFSRCAVDVFCHPDFQIRQRVADRSPLYFTHERMRREVYDQSQGWGSNSRWRTRFRFDYEESDRVIFNAGGQYDLAAPVSLESASSPNHHLPTGPRRELLVHRCFVTYEGPWDDWYPYDDTLAVRKAETMWPLEEGQLVPLSQCPPGRAEP